MLLLIFWKNFLVISKNAEFFINKNSEILVSCLALSALKVVDFGPSNLDVEIDP